MFLYALQAGARPDGQLSFMAVDALVRMVSIIVLGGGGEPFLSRFLAMLVGGGLHEEFIVLQHG